MLEWRKQALRFAVIALVLTPLVGWAEEVAYDKSVEVELSV